MGVSTEPVAPSASRDDRYVRWLPRRVQGATSLRRLALASVIANVVIVVTGGAVRLTDSGLGCPTWPRCTDATLTPTKQYAIHGIIEFTNRQLTFVLVLVAIATWLVAMARRSERPLATWALVGIPAQAVLGGFTVLTHLNPWLVGAHFLLSMVIIAITFALWWRLAGLALSGAAGAPGAVGASPPPAYALLARLTGLVTVATLVVGTIVTGAGPHAGSKADDGKVHRNGLKVSSMAQLHADTVMVLIGLTVGLVMLAYALHLSPALRRGAVVLLGVELAQGIIGYTQYFLHVPPLLVGLHMFGACLVWLAVLRVIAQSPAGGRARGRQKIWVSV